MLKTWIPRLLFTAFRSGGGKTTITCAILRALCDLGKTPFAFKCGPDYIDPMFHTEVLGVKSRNLDLFLLSEQICQYLLVKNTQASDIAILEGVMGYYDGLGANSSIASSYHLAQVTETPAILIVDCKGASFSLTALIKGFVGFRQDSRIEGIILNELSAAMYPLYKKMIEEETGIQVVGYFPHLEECSLASRHLGLVTAAEVQDLQLMLDKLGQQAKETIDLEVLLDIASRAKELPALEGMVQEQIRKAKSKAGAESELEAEAEGEKVRTGVDPRADTDVKLETGVQTQTQAQTKIKTETETETETETDKDKDKDKDTAVMKPVTVAVAKDKAFCFYYQDSLELLEELGVQIRYFSPLYDSQLPPCDGVILGGGYPEVYAQALAANHPMRTSLKAAISQNTPCLAECGGFMYLLDEMTDQDGNAHPMVGAIQGKAWLTPKLNRFGYVMLTSEKDNLLARKGDQIPAHEFHYSESSNNGKAFTAKKPTRDTRWSCIHADQNLYAGYPHIHLWGNIQFAARFVERCRQYQAGREDF